MAVYYHVVPRLEMTALSAILTALKNEPVDCSTAAGFLIIFL